MRTLLELISEVKVGVWQFWRLVSSANHDYPYHDYVKLENEEQDDAVIPYIVGSSNIRARGDQSKLFVAKRTLLWSPNTIDFRLNSPNNVLIRLKPHGVDASGTIYQMELHTNIHAIYFVLETGFQVHAYFEGVLPYEARNPE